MDGKNYRQYLVFFILYFFFNSLLLPEGLLYTTFLTPVFLYWIYKNHKFKKFTGYLLLILIPIPFHLAGGIDNSSYLISFTLIVTVVVFFMAMVMAIKYSRDDLSKIFRYILYLNMMLVVVAIILIPFQFGRDLLWYSIPISPNIPAFPRLKLFTYESSYYALIMFPVFLYFLLKIFWGESKNPLLLLAAIMIPLILSLSFGVLGAFIISLLFVSLIYFKRLPGSFRRFLVYGGISFVAISLLLLFSWPDNPVFLRIENIITGTDTSGKGRLYESFLLAFDILKSKGYIFGCGPGQIKIIVPDLIRELYGSRPNLPETFRIPNSMGEMLATYGFYGFLLKLILEVTLFFRFKVYRNVYSFCLFLFIFIYQFTGSFLISTAEITAWALVFHSNFKEFRILPSKDRIA